MIGGLSLFLYGMNIMENGLSKMAGGRLERVSDHCSNVAVEMITIYDNDYSTHEYFKSFSPKEQRLFNTEYEKLISKYTLSQKG